MWGQHITDLLLPVQINPDVPLEFGVTYTRRFNNRHSRAGHLFQGRFKSMVVENDAYVVELS